MSEWKKVKLGEISQTIQTGPFGSQLHQSDYSVIGIPVVMPKDIIAGNIEEASIARVEQHHIDRLSRHMISYGDILYARRGDVGKCAFTKQNQEGWLCGTGCLRVTINPDMANPKFVFFQLQKQVFGLQLGFDNFGLHPVGGCGKLFGGCPLLGLGPLLFFRLFGRITF